MSYTAVTVAEVAADPDLADWRVVHRSLRAEFAAGSFRAAAGLATSIAAAADEAGHHPDLGVRYPDRVAVTLTTHATGGLTTRDTDLARVISGLAAAADARPRLDLIPQAVTISIDTADASRLRPFWGAVLGYEDRDGDLVPAGRDGPEVSFQAAPHVPEGRHRVHLDVYVPAAEAPARVAAALAAGGRLVTDEFAPEWWVLADAEDNVVCVCC